MTLQLSSGQRRTVALGLLLLTVALIVTAFALPTWWLHARYDRFLEDYSDRQQRYQRVAALRPDINAAITDVMKLDARKHYLNGASPTLAGAELQSLVTRIIETHKGRIASSQVLANTEETKTPGALKIALQVQMAASMIPLQLILHAIETSEPTLFIDKLTVTSNFGRGYRPEPGVQPEFQVQLTISGYSPMDGGKS
jgi:hypothetical protein